MDPAASFTFPSSYPALEQATAAAARAVGPVTLSTDQLTDSRAFKHTAHPLETASAALEVLVDPTVVWRWHDRAWRLLVEWHLLPVLDVEVSLAEAAYNSAYAAWVDGLTGNDEAVGWYEVTVDEQEVAHAYRAAAASLSGETDPTPSSPRRGLRPNRPSTLSDGLAGLVGRRVEVRLVGHTDVVCGTVVAFVDGSLVVAGDGLTVVPVAAVAAASTWQYTADEVAAADLDH